MPRSSEQVSIQIGGGHAPQCSSKLNVQWSEPPIHWVHSQGLQISCRYPCIAALVFLQDTFSALILYKRSFGTQRSSILTTSPSQHRCFSRAYVLMTSAHSSTAVYGILSCQVMRRMRRRTVMWNVLSLLSCQAEGPRLTAVYKCTQDRSSVNLYLCLFCEVHAKPYSLYESGECSSYLASASV